MKTELTASHYMAGLGTFPLTLAQLASILGLGEVVQTAGTISECINREEYN